MNLTYFILKIVTCTLYGFLLLLPGCFYFLIKWIRKKSFKKFDYGIMLFHAILICLLFFIKVNPELVRDYYGCYLEKTHFISNLKSKKSTLKISKCKNINNLRVYVLSFQGDYSEVLKFIQDNNLEAVSIFDYKNLYSDTFTVNAEYRIFCDIGHWYTSDANIIFYRSKYDAYASRIVYLFFDKKSQHGYFQICYRYL